MTTLNESMKNAKREVVKALKEVENLLNHETELEDSKKVKKRLRKTWNHLIDALHDWE